MRDSKPFLKMLREDGDFQGYCGVKFSEKNLSKFSTYFERTGQEECIYSIFQKDSSPANKCQQLNEKKIILFSD